MVEEDETGERRASFSIMQSRKSLLQAHIIALVLDAEEVYICYMYFTFWTTPHNYDIIQIIF